MSVARWRSRTNRGLPRRSPVGTSPIAPRLARYPSSLSTYFAAPVRYVAFVALGLSLAGFGTWGVKQGLDARAAKQAECAAEIRAWSVRNQVLAKSHVRRADACVDLRALVGDLE